MPLRREQVYIDDTDLTEKIASYHFQDDKVVVKYKTSDKPYIFGRKRVRIVPTGVSSEEAFDVFKYLKDIAYTIGLKTEDGENILANSYEGIEVIPEDGVLANFLNASLAKHEVQTSEATFFPFGFNLSQKDALNNAFSSRLSVIEGPPGTGKTQTILNIIATAVLKGQSVAVVSSNNSATRNVYEKLERNGIGFIAAMLGSTQNKKEFIEGQTAIPDLSSFELSEEEAAHIKEETKSLFHDLTDYLGKKNALATLKLQMDNIQTEYEHFKTSQKGKKPETAIFKKGIGSDNIFEFWINLEQLSKARKKPNILQRLILRFKYGIKQKEFYAKPLEDIISFCQAAYYPAKIGEMKNSMQALEQSLAQFAFDSKMKDYTQKSMKLLKAALYTRYNEQKRPVFHIADLRAKSRAFIQTYPVVMSTTYSLRGSLSSNLTYDYVIIDEASQVDLATGALALSCAKRAVIVGDRKQLPNVVNDEMQAITDAIFDAYKLPEAYRYANHSLLSAILALMPEVSQTLLREHYRCHPKIIEFCNAKFYNNQLIVHTPYTHHRQPLVVYKTVQGNHARQRMNQRQIDVIVQEIIPNEKLEGVDLGIVTPYRNQTNALQQTFRGTGIMADTVDKFQGRENEVIILSTVDNEITAFTDNPNRLNVAVSRAIDQLIVVVNGNEQADGNISDLIKYIEYNNYSIVESELNSVFDLLYKGYEEVRSKMLHKTRKASVYDSENLMYSLIKEVLAADEFIKYDVLLHFPLRQLIKDFSKLNEVEKKYASHPWTHLDFLIYNKLGKVPVLAIEVDGYEFHKDGTKQAERDQLKESILNKFDFPLLRFKTNESNEREKLIRALNAT